MVATQSDTDYVRPRILSKGVKLAAYIWQSMLGRMRVLCSCTDFLYITVGNVCIYGVYGQGVRSANKVRDWLEEVGGVLGSGRWVLVGD